MGAQSRPDLTWANRRPEGEIHVATNGSDSNPGTKTKPVQTIGEGLRRVQPGQAVVVHGGRYKEKLTATRDGTAEKPIVVSAAPKERPVVVGVPEADIKSAKPFFRLVHRYWVVRGLEFDGSVHPGVALRVQAANVLIERVNAHSGRGQAGVVFHQATSSALRNSRIHDFSFPGSESHGVLVLPDSRSILVTGNNSWGNSGDSLQCSGVFENGFGTANPVDVTVEDNRYGSRHPDGTARPADRENAVDIKSCERVSIRGNKLMGYRGSPTSKQGSALVVHVQADAVLIEHNRIWDSNAAASMGSATNSGLGLVVFRRNLVFNLVNSGSLTGGAFGVRVGPARRAEIYNNTLFAVPHDATPSRDNYALRLADDGPVQQASVLNNVVDGTGRTLPLGSVGDLKVEANLSWRTLDTPSGFRSADPRWRSNPVNEDFYTTDKSPARDSGVDTGASYCGKGVDIGFLETCTADKPAAKTVDLAKYVLDFSRTIPGKGSEGYRAPTDTQAGQLQAAVRAAQGGKVAEARSLLASMDYDVVQLRDGTTSRALLALRERQRSNGTYAHGWGLFLVRPGAKSPLLVEVPHPRTETNIEDTGVAAFRAVDARGLLLAGARRDANADGSADVAHRTDSAFAEVHAAMTTKSRRVLQLHGFSSSGHPGEKEAVVSPGATASSTAARAVRDRLRKAGVTACIFDAKTCGKGLGATTNVQGKQAAQVNAVFVHVELGESVRKDANRRRGAAKASALAMG